MRAGDLAELTKQYETVKKAVEEIKSNNNKGDPFHKKMKVRMTRKAFAARTLW